VSVELAGEVAALQGEIAALVDVIRTDILAGVGGFTSVVVAVLLAPLFVRRRRKLSHTLIIDGEPATHYQRAAREVPDA